MFGIPMDVNFIRAPMVAIWDEKGRDLILVTGLVFDQRDGGASGERFGVDQI